MKIIKQYLLKDMLMSILAIMLALLAMFAFFDLLQELENLDKGSYGIAKIFLFVLLSAPGHIYEIAPVAVLIGTMYTLANLARHSELVVLRVNGLSITEIGRILLRVGVIFTLITFIVGELLAPLTEKTAQHIRLKAIDSVIAQDFRSGLWVKDGLSFVNAEQVMPDAELTNLHIYTFNKNFELDTINIAKSAKYNGKDWDLTEVSTTHFSSRGIDTKTQTNAHWQSLIKPELMSILLVLPEKMSAWNLYSYIGHLSKNKQKTSRYEIALWGKIIYPIACLVMVIIALPFGFIQQRSGGVAHKILAGIMLGIIYQVLNKVFLHLGLLNDWSAFYSAVTPTLLFLMAGLSMLIWAESN
jgi:lipopolysaccharide export system permease protein